MIRHCIRFYSFAFVLIPCLALAADAKPLDAKLGKADEKAPFVWFDIRDLGIESEKRNPATS